MVRGRKAGNRPAGRRLSQRVKTAKGRSTSSQRWLSRQLNDPYVEGARRRGYRSRAAFKLIEIDDKLHLLRPGMRVLDLGAAPGGWTQVAVERTKAGSGAGPDAGRVVALDVLAIAASHLAAVSERRVEQLVNPSLSGLPPFLADRLAIGR